METNMINEEILKSFYSLTVIDLNADKVSEYDNTLKEVVSLGFEEYLNNLRKVIHPDCLKQYYDQISINNLSENENKVIYYQKLSNLLSYCSYYDLIRLIGPNKALIISIKSDSKLNVKTEKATSDYDFTSMMINIQNMVSTVKTDDEVVKTALQYINTSLDDAIKTDPLIKKEYTNKVNLSLYNGKETLLIADDDNLTRNIFKKVFEDTYEIMEAQNGEEAVELIEKNVINPTPENHANIVGMFLDLKMPVMDGFGVLDYLKDKKIIHKIPVIIISADDTKETKEQVYIYDIADMIEKPFNFELIRKRVSNMTRMYVKNNVINDVIRTQDRELKTIIKSYVKGFLTNYESINNKKNVYYEKLLNKYNEVSDNKYDVNKVLRASNYYDLGLDFIPKSFINNINNLEKKEKDIVLNYSINGSNILKYILENESDSFNEIATNICLLHNERFDGKGFPKGVKEKHIPPYVYLFNMALECANTKLAKEEIISQILSKEGSKYSSDSIQIFKSVMNDLF